MTESFEMSSPKRFSPSYVLPSCTLRSLRRDDLEAISNRLAEMDPWKRLGYSPEGLVGYFQRPDPALYRYAILKSGLPAGVFCFRFPWLMGPFLEVGGIYPEFQRLGVGGELMQWIESLEPGFRNIWTTVSSFNIRSLKFCHRHGFRETGILVDLIKAGHDEILLRKTLIKEL
jgi:ribosomal protein S18 acetylase RimI-like enzyme